MANADETFMRVALGCARLGRGSVEPNPMVGAVIARGGVEVSRGWHKRFGGPHAEREALSAARAAGALVRGATMYVTLEPCCHHGKTPPCTDAIIDAGIGRVVVAMTDPDDKVAGKGLAVLRQAGVSVEVGLCEDEAADLLAPYVKLRTQRRPWVICKWAQTSDGRLALGPQRGRWISGEQSRAHAHELRGLCDGVLVGIGTVLADDPLLTNRSGEKQPARVVLDSNLRIPTGGKLVRSADRSPVIVATSHHAAANEVGRADALARAGAEILELPRSPGGLNLETLLDELGRRQWTHLLVEGGAKVLSGFIEADLADELVVFVGPQVAGDAPNLPRFDIEELSRRLRLELRQRQKFGPDTMRRFRVGR